MTPDQLIAMLNAVWYGGTVPDVRDTYRDGVCYGTYVCYGWDWQRVIAVYAETFPGADLDTVSWVELPPTMTAASPEAYNDHQPI